MNETTAPAIIRFLLARFAEEEVVARAAAAEGAPDWQANPEPSSDGDRDLFSAWQNIMVGVLSDWGVEAIVYDEGTPSIAEATHIARHDPARVLAQLEVNRRIVARIDYFYDPEGGGSEIEAIRYTSQGVTIALLASLYADHPDFNEEWRI